MTQPLKSEIAKKSVELEGRKIEVYLMKVDYPYHTAIKPYARFIDGKSNSRPKIKIEKKTLRIGGKEYPKEVIAELKKELDKIKIEDCI